MHAKTIARTPSRRPVGLKRNRLLQKLATQLSDQGITPNAISLGSIVCALMAATAIIAFGQIGGLPLAIIASFLVFSRGLCNLLDGLLAIENDHPTPTGAFFNEAPDRLADILLFTGTGLAWNLSWMGLSAGLGLSLLCVTTSYLRALGKALIGEDDFRGPLAKPHRIGVLITGLLLTPFLPEAFPAWEILLAVLFLGTLLTIVTRTIHILKTLNTEKAHQ
jgi:phosphatidylglycerophosphate synthase